MNTMSPELEARILEAVTKMPGFPNSVQRILELTRDVNCSPKALIEVIQKDPVITLKVLHLINSAYYRMPESMSSIGQAVVYLGLNTIKNMALSLAAAGMLPRSNPAHFDTQRFLMHSLITASAARGVCARWAPNAADANDAYLAGLLHDFGKIVLAQHLPQEFRAALELAHREGLPLHLAEEREMGVDHAYVGAMLAERWHFPKALVDCIRNHHRPAADTDVLGQVLALADRISERFGHDASGHVLTPDYPWVLPERFGTSLEVIIEELGGEEKFVQDALAYAQLS
jgi:putative nucleotidyltransferase with HDIG domain